MEKERIKKFPLEDSPPEQLSSDTVFSISLRKHSVEQIPFCDAEKLSDPVSGSAEITGRFIC